MTREGYCDEKIDTDLSGLKALMAAATKVKSLDLSQNMLGPASAAEISVLVSDADAALASMTISGVFTLVTTPYYYQLPISLDTFILVIQLA